MSLNVYRVTQGMDVWMWTASLGDESLVDEATWLFISSL